MRTITVHMPPWPKAPAVVIPVKVSWPELRLTEEQQFANAFARAYDQPEPYPDPSIINIRIELT